MGDKAFRVTRMFLNHAPSVYLTISALILLYYIWTEPYRGWRFIAAAVGCMIMAYFAKRIRYNLIDRRGRSLEGARLYIQLHIMTLVLIPHVQKSMKEMNSETERQAFYQDTYMDAYNEVRTDRRSQIINQLRILALVAFLGLVIVAAIHAANEYVTFETISARAN